MSGLGQIFLAQVYFFHADVVMIFHLRLKDFSSSFVFFLQLW